MLDLLQGSGVAPVAAQPDVYAIVPDAQALPVVTRVAEALRGAGVSVVVHGAGKEGQGGMKSQFKKADASGARYALIFGADELAQGLVAIKPLRDAAAAQTTQALSDVAAWAATLRNA